MAFHKSLSRAQMWCYAAGQLGWAALSGIVGSWLVYFYQPDDAALAEGMNVFVPQGRVCFGALTIIGLITAAGRIFDAITDPLVGNWSDNCRSRRGRRIPFLRAAAVPLGLATLLIFVPPVQHLSGLNSTWLFIFVLLYYFLITCYSTPYTSLLAELAHTQEEKLKVSTCISLTYIVGMALGYTAPMLWGAFTATGMERVPAMQATFAILCAAATAFMLVPAFTIDEREFSRIESPQCTMFSSLLKTFANRNFRIFVAQDAIYFLALTMFQTGLPFFVTSLLHLPESRASQMFIALTAASLLFYPLVTFLARKFGKKKVVMAAFAFFFADFLFTGLCGNAIPIPTGAQAALIVAAGAFPIAAFGILPQAMVADIAQHERESTGENRAGMFFAARTFAFKLGQSAAMIVFTSLATISQANALGYRIVAAAASACCALGALILSFFNERNILGNKKDAD